MAEQRMCSVTGQGLRINSVRACVAPATQNACYLIGVSTQEQLLSAIYAKAQSVKGLVESSGDRVTQPPAAGERAAPTAFRLSTSGRDFLIQLEGAIRHCYVPKDRSGAPAAQSGVTLGVGYDMGSRSSAAVKADLVAAGVDPNSAAALSQGAGLRGAAADQFAKSHSNVALTDSQISGLLDRISDSYAAYVYRNVSQPISQGQFDALFCLAFNRPAALVSGRTPPLLNDSRWLDAADAWLAETAGLSILLNRRRKEVYYFLRSY